MFLGIGEIDLLNNTQLLTNTSLDNSKKHFPFELQTKVYCKNGAKYTGNVNKGQKIIMRKKNTMKKKKEV